MYQQQWNNDHIYQGLDSPELEADMNAARHALEELASYMAGLDGVRGDDAALQDFLREVRLRARDIRHIGWNVAILAACRGSQDARDRRLNSWRPVPEPSTPICSRPWRRWTI